MTTLLSQILRAPENVVYQAIQQFQIPWAGAAWTGIDTALTYAERTSPYFNRNFYLHQIFSNVINTGWLVWDVALLAIAFKQKKISYHWPLTLSMFGCGPLFYFLENRFRQKYPILIETPTEMKQKGVTLSYSLPLSQSYIQALYLSRMVMNVAAAYLFPFYRVWTALNALGLGYSFLKNRQLKWLKFSREFQFPKKPPLELQELSKQNKVLVDRIRCDYLVPLFSNQNAQANCTLCQAENPPFSFCVPHAPSDLDCLVNQIFKSSDNLLNDLKLSFEATKRSMNSVNIGTSYNANLTIPESSLPKCLECRNSPANHTLDAQYFDQVLPQEHFKTSLFITPDPKASHLKFVKFDTLWARVNALYSSFQFGLALMQKHHPDLAAKIAIGQKILSLFDVGSIVYHSWKLYDLLYDKYVIKKAQQETPQSSLKNAEQNLENARLQHSQLQDSLQEAIANRTILKVTGKYIALSEKGQEFLDKLKPAIDALAALPIQATETQQKVENKLQSALTHGDIISTTGEIPLSPNAVNIFRKLGPYLKNQQIQLQRHGTQIHYVGTNPETEKFIQDYTRACEIGEIVSVNCGCIPLSPSAQEVLKEYQSAWIQNWIRKASNGQLQFSNAGKEIYKNVQTLIQTRQILVIEPEALIPLTPETEDMIRNQPLVLQNFQTAINQHETAKKQANDSHTRLQNTYHTKLIFALLAGSAVFAGSSALLVNFLNKKFKTIDLTEILKKVASPSDVNKIQVTWSLPWLPYLAQVLVAYRIFTSLALATFSPDQRTYAFSALFQGATLWNLAQLPYLKLVRTFFNPINTVSRADVSFDILLPIFHPLKSECASLASHLESNLKSIYNYTTQFLNKSSWTYWLTKTNGVHTGTKYLVNLHTSPLDVCKCKIKAVFEQITGWAIDRRYGNASLVFSYPPS